ncbi:MAG: 50S ribosomal protein L17 [Verrucomicrobia bacterium]|nr:50S ribosomal protein L17 [Verrucomicrobiota bacterium]
MRHRKNTAKLGMKSQHKRATLANLVSSLIKHKRIRTTVARAKVARRLADKMVTLGKQGTLAARRLAIARLSMRGPGPDLDKEARQRWHKNQDVVRILFEEIAPSFKDRQGGYTRVVRVGNRLGDAAEMAILEWTGTVVGPVEPKKKDKKTKDEKKT